MRARPERRRTALHRHRLRSPARNCGAGERAAVHHERFLARVDSVLPLPRALRRHGEQERACAKAHDLRADGCASRCAHDFAPGARGRQPQLGLPLLLGARREPDAAGAGFTRLLRRGASVLRIPARGARAAHRRAADHVRRGYGARSHRARARAPRWLSRKPAGAHWKRGLQPAPSSVQAAPGAGPGHINRV